MSHPKLLDNSRPDGELCPACGAPLARLHRHFLDRWISLFTSVHRYRCVAPGCDWEGLLGREVGSPRVRAVLLWAAVLFGFALGVAATLALQDRRVTQSPPPAKTPVAAAPLTLEGQSLGAPAGQDFDGAALHADDLRAQGNATPLQLRIACAWGVPGRNPYQGTVEQALSAAHVPADVVRQISAQAAVGTHQRVEITWRGIRTVDHGRYFGKTIRAMAFGDTLCFDTRVNFNPGHVEYASLYEAKGRDGKAYAVMVPFVCGNVSLLQERTPQTDIELPTPGTAALVLLGLAAAAAAAAWRRRGGVAR
ncbi:MAG: hypothetical protein C0505_11250 [Leptothrix sp. (in: Bacteria)]|nr:hypothetical protein [Leptothrix sp. (in: b-proteobacteria)]